MRRISRHTARTLLALSVAAATLGGCHSMGPHAREGAAIGSVLGAGAGWAIGAHNDHTAAGILGGALLGGVLGAAIGDEHDYAHRRPVTVQRYPTTRRVEYRTYEPTYVVHPAPRVVYVHPRPYRVVHRYHYYGY